MSRFKYLLVAALFAFSAKSTTAQAPNASLLQEQASAMAALNFMDGEWVGTVEVMERSGGIKLTQTERSGTLLGGTIRLVEGRAFDAKGKTLFNALAIISYDTRRDLYSITSHASGFATTTELKVKPNGFAWEVPAGPGAKVQFEAVVKNGVWTEVGHYVGADGKPRKTVEMRVRKLRPTEWPAGDILKRK